jgi:hypothetical protein
MSTVYRRTVALAFATLTVGAAAVATTAAPAHAVANPVLVSASSVLGSPNLISATAQCPAGFNLVGTAGRTVGAAGLVTMTDVIPDVATNSVTVFGNENGNGTGQNWIVEATAFCDQVITGVVQVAQASALDGVSPKTVVPVCPANTNLTGVGFELTGAGGDVFPDDVVPNAALTAATLTGYDNGAAGNWSIIGYALCAPLPMGAAPVVVSSSTGFNNNPAKSVTSPNCPAGTRAVGVGGQMTGATGDAILTQMTPNSVATRGTAGADAFAGFNGNWMLAIFAVCW